MKRGQAAVGWSVGLAGALGLSACGMEPARQEGPSTGVLATRQAALIPASATSDLGNEAWQTLGTLGSPVAREEAAFAAQGGRAYLLGGRGMPPGGVFDPGALAWSLASPPPLQLHHFQALTLGDAIYVVGAMTGNYPNEVPVADIYTYTPSLDTWSVVGQVPEGRRRGAAGLVFHQGNFYLVGGIQNGHIGGFVPWLDRYDPASGDWEVLSDAPRARDHFQAAVIDGQLYAAGGRTTSLATNEVFTLTIPEVDVYDFGSGLWRTLPATGNLPTPRAGSYVAALGEWLLVIGGESGRSLAHAEVEALYAPSGEWLALPSLVQGRHGTGVVQLDDALFVTAGSANRGGGPLLTTTERWSISARTQVADAGAPEEGPGKPATPDAGVADAGAPGVTALVESLSGPPLSIDRSTLERLPLAAVPLAAVPLAAVPLQPPRAVDPPPGIDPSPIEPSFSSSNLAGERLQNPTSLQFGPDGRLYVSQQNGLILIYAVERTGANAYRIIATETLSVIQQIQNHDDDTGAVNARVVTREVTGLLVAGSAEFPVLYVSSSDPRIGAGGGATDLNLDTNSGIVSRLTWTGTEWQHVELVRGLPRSEENHASNGLALDAASNVLYLAQGGHTNAGAPSNNFAFTTEYALSGAILRIDLGAIDALPSRVDASGIAFKYELETLDDPLKPNANGIENPDAPGYDGVDLGDPFGGNDGFNQAKWKRASPVQVHAGGLRNPFDLLLTESGRLYTVDNGANPGWGGHPAGEAAYPGPLAGSCTNAYIPGEPGSTQAGPNDPAVNNENGLHWVQPLTPGELNYPGQAESYYPGHPNPIRANPLGAGLYRNNQFLAPGDPALPVDWPPVEPELAHPAECDFRNPGETDNSLTTFSDSTNGITEYTAPNFGGALRGTLLLAGYNGSIYQVRVSPDGRGTLNCPPNPARCTDSLASGFGRQPLDVTAQGAAGPFPGTVWIANIGSSSITVLEPADYDTVTPPSEVPCSQRAAGEPAGDADGDGYSNADEAQNGTNPCSSASRPSDADGDALSDRNDPDDDNDGIPDLLDPFALDPDNGLSTPLPIEYEFFSAFPGTGLFGLGFTGLMSNGSSDYLTQFDADAVIAGGTSGLLTVPQVTAGDARSSLDTQDNAFLFGIDPQSSSAEGGVFTVYAKVNGPFFDALPPAASQAVGVFLGTGDQDNYLSLTLDADQGLALLLEVNGDASASLFPETGVALLDAISLTLYLRVDPESGSVSAAYQTEGGARVALGAPVPLEGSLLDAIHGSAKIGGSDIGLAVGVIGTSRGAAPFAATWDYLKVASGEPNAQEPTKMSAMKSQGPLTIGRATRCISGSDGGPVLRDEARLARFKH